MQIENYLNHKNMSDGVYIVCGETMFRDQNIFFKLKVCIEAGKGIPLNLSAQEDWTIYELQWKNM